MRADPILVKRVTRAASFTLVGVAIIATAVNLHGREPTVPPVEAPPHVADPLGAELARCRDIARPEDVDDSCRAAWTEVRRRFFAPHDASEARP